MLGILMACCQTGYQGASPGSLSLLPFGWWEREPEIVGVLGTSHVLYGSIQVLQVALKNFLEQRSCSLKELAVCGRSTGEFFCFFSLPQTT